MGLEQRKATRIVARDRFCTCLSIHIVQPECVQVIRSMGLRVCNMFLLSSIDTYCSRNAFQLDSINTILYDQRTVLEPNNYLKLCLVLVVNI